MTMHAQANHGRDMPSGRKDSKAGTLEKLRASESLQIPCAIKQTQPDKCHKTDIKRQSGFLGKWSPKINFLRKIDGTTYIHTSH